MLSEICLIRHGETAWSLSGAHTGRTDIPLTPQGEERAALLGRYLHGRSFSMVLVSPLRRARETCRIAGYGEVARVEPDLVEWDYGAYEGLTTEEIRKDRPGWSIWDGGAAGGETIGQVAARAARVIDRAAQSDGQVALFAHAHILRILTACWLGLPPVTAQRFALGTASVSVLGFERDTRVIRSWNLCPE